VRALVLGFALVGCASAPPLVEGETIAVLSPAQLEQAFEGRAACFVYPEDGACENLGYADSFGSRVRTSRSVGATDISKLASDPVVQVIARLPMFESYRDLFRRLEAARAAGDFKYVKEVVVDEFTLDTQTNRWCSRIPLNERFRGSELYFSNTLSSNIAGDRRMDPALAEELGAFLRAVISDPEFRSVARTRAAENDQLESMERLFSMLGGELDLCASYAGVVQQGRIELTGMTTYLGGNAEPSMDRVVRPYPRDAEVPLRGN
jgi:hypothetical protein